MTTTLEQVAVYLGIRSRREQAVSPFALIERIEEGLPITALNRVSHFMAPSDVNFKYLIIPRATLARRKKRRDKLSVDEGDRVVRLAKAWAFAREVWGSDEDARAFFFRPHQMLEGRKPIDVLLGTDTGARLVEEILGRLKYGSAA